VISATFFLLERFAVKGIQFYPNFPVEFGQGEEFLIAEGSDNPGGNYSYCTFYCWFILGSPYPGGMIAVL
jgi:hypothetical protein